MKNYHNPVMLKESVEGLGIKSGGIYVDATFGGGGHSMAILQKTKGIKLFAFDQDNDAVEIAQKIQSQHDNFVFIKSNFRNLRTELSLNRIKKIDGIIFDLGISSHQIDKPERGFSFMADGDLDMRMNQKNELSAKEVVNTYSREQLRNILFQFGEEREADRIARRIIEERKKKEIKTTSQLSEIIGKSIHSKFHIKAKARVFQALRIYVNREIESLNQALKESVEILNPKGRIVVISYHSIEDRVVKQFFKYENLDCVCPVDYPKCLCNKVSTLKIITKKPLVPTEIEIRANSRARSAKMRIAERQEV